MTYVVRLQDGGRHAVSKFGEVSMKITIEWVISLAIEWM